MKCTPPDSARECSREQTANLRSASGNQYVAGHSHREANSRSSSRKTRQGAGDADVRVLVARRSDQSGPPASEKTEGKVRGHSKPDETREGDESKPGKEQPP